MEIQLFTGQTVRFSNCQSSNFTLINGTTLDLQTRVVTSLPKIDIAGLLNKHLPNLRAYPTDADVEQSSISVGFRNAYGTLPGLYQGYIKVIRMETLIRKIVGDTVPMESANLVMQLGPFRCSNSNPSYYNEYGSTQHEFSSIDACHSLKFNGSGDACFSADTLKISSPFLQHWNNNKCTWTSTVSLNLVVSQLSGPDPGVSDYLDCVRTMLTKQLCCDAAIVAKNGVELNCHRSILAAHSPVFEATFHTDMVEAETGRVEMPDMAEESVRAMLEYLYVWELKTPRENSLVCFELREAGHKYGIESLEKATEKILLKMNADWYDTEVALRLYLFTRGLELEALKVKAVQVMKSKIGKLREVPAYKKLFQENVDIAMEISECFATIC